MLEEGTNLRFMSFCLMLFVLNHWRIADQQGFLIREPSCSTNKRASLLIFWGTLYISSFPFSYLAASRCRDREASSVDAASNRQSSQGNKINSRGKYVAGFIKRAHLTYIWRRSVNIRVWHEKCPKKNHSQLISQENSGTNLSEHKDPLQKSSLECCLRPFLSAHSSAEHRVSARKIWAMTQVPAD